MKLICFPYAGGSCRVYTELFRQLHSDFDLLYMEYPGHGMKSDKPLLYDLESVAKDLFAELEQAHVFQSDYVLYGHSMGALISFLIAHMAMEKGYRSPEHMIVSGRSSPVVPETKQRHKLDSIHFWDSLSDMGRIPDELIANIDLRKFFEQILRADLTAVETWQWKACSPLNCPITVWYGDNENINHDEASAWQQVTGGPVNVQCFAGKHFFIFEHRESICNWFNQMLCSLPMHAEY